MRVWNALSALSIFVTVLSAFFDIPKKTISGRTAIIFLVALFIVIFAIVPANNVNNSRPEGLPSGAGIPDKSLTSNTGNGDNSHEYTDEAHQDGGVENTPSSGSLIDEFSIPSIEPSVILSGKEIIIQYPLNEINGSLSSDGQTNDYWFLSKVSGQYRFEMSNLDPEVKVNISVYNASGNELASTTYGVGNNEGLTIGNIVSNQKYQIKITQYSKYSEYVLTVGVPSETKDISGLTQVSDHIEYTGQINKYTYIPSVTGRYRFEISELDPLTKVDVTIYNTLGNKIAGTSYGVENGGGITVDDLTAGQQYEIQVSHYSKYSNYILLIGSQTATTDISDSDQVSDSIKFRNQIIKYTYTPRITGQYRFEVSELDPSAKVDIAIYNASGNKIAGTSYGVENGGGITVDDLTANHQYEIWVSHYSKYSNYILLIGSQTATTDISNLKQVSDNIKFRNQINKYTYTPSITGRYRFEISELDPSAKVDVAIYNTLGNKIAGTSYGVENGGGITVDDLTAGQQYEIQVSHYSKYSNYILLIGSQTATTDISDSDQVSGNIEFRDQIVKYTYTPRITGQYHLEVFELDPSTKVDIAIYNASGNKIAGTSYGVENGGSITVDELTANQQYEIRVFFYNKYSPYSLGIVFIN